MKKRFFGIILSFSMLLSMLPVAALAAEPAGGTDSAAEEAQALIDALPATEEVKDMDIDGQREAYDRVQYAYDAYMALSEQQQALITGDEAFDALFAFFNSQIMPLEGGAAPLEGSAVPLDEDPVPSADGTVQTMYNDRDGVGQYVTATALGAGDTFLTDGWYVVLRGTVTVDNVIYVGELNGETAMDVNLILADGGTLNANGGIVVFPGTHFTIWCQSGGSGQLSAKGMENSAGIGGNSNTASYEIGDSNATVTINGGSISATGGNNGAGIGGGEAGNGPKIIINGGSVTATGGNNGAGIGGGWLGAGNVEINGGSVTATGGDNGAGIGGGYMSKNKTVVSISHSSINVSGGQNGAGIGTGIESGDCDITIDNSTVRVNTWEVYGRPATAAPGIGSGKDTDAGVEVNIKLTGGGDYIILANDSRAFSVKPVFENFNHVVESYYNWGVDPYLEWTGKTDAVWDYAAIRIKPITSWEISVSSPESVLMDDVEEQTVDLSASLNFHVGNLTDHRYNVSGYCEFETDNPNVTFNKGKLTIPASEKGKTIKGKLNYAGGELFKDISIDVLYHCTIEYAGDAVEEEAQTVLSGTEITLPDAPGHTGYRFLGWRCSADDTDYQPGASYTAAGNVTFTARWEQKDLSYSAEGAVITEHSRAGGDAYRETAEIKAPEGDLVYDGNPKAATVIYSPGWKGGELEIIYSDDNCTNAGHITAGITIEGITAGVQYTIEKDHSAVTAQPVGAHLTYTGKEQALVTAGAGTGGTMQYSLTSGGPYSADIPTATEEDSYMLYPVSIQR